MNKLDCWVLNEVDSDYSAVWMILSILRRRLPDTDESTVEKLLNETLSSLLERRLVKVYTGTDFSGEEVDLELSELPEDFVCSHKDDWKNKRVGDADYRFLITDEGLDLYLNNCSSDYFDENKGGGF
jgi:hypothetical protein